MTAVKPYSPAQLFISALESLEQEKSTSQVSLLCLEDAAEHCSQAWITAQTHLQPQHLDQISPNRQIHSTVHEAFYQLRQARATDSLFGWFLSALDFTPMDGRTFMLNFNAQIKCEDLSILFQQTWTNITVPGVQATQPGSSNAVFVIDRLHTWLEAWFAPIAQIGGGSDEQKAYHDCFLACFDHHFSPDFPPVLLDVLAFLFHGPTEDPTDPSSQDVEYDADKTRLQLLQLDLLSRYQSVLFRFINQLIESKVADECGMDWQERHLDRLKHWLDNDLHSWLSALLGLDPPREGQQMTEREKAQRVDLKSHLVKFDFHLCKTLCLLRISELFDIIVEYPDSIPACEDLKICLSRTDDRPLLVNSLRQAIVARLLHPGASTKDIISQYINAIRTLRLIDPPGVLLSRVAEPIRSYLRSREETIREIMSNLIEEGGDLVSELQGGAGEIEMGKQHQEAEDYSDRHWMPDPLDAPPDFHLNKRSDIIQMLVSIYDSKELLIKEFQVLLARSLLNIKGYDADRQIRNVEILKKRFGDSDFEVCEVMLKDIADSKRIDTNVHSLAAANPIHPMVISKLFWPQLQTNELKVYGQMAALQESYQKAFAVMKPDKRLQWLPNMGSVEVDIEMDDRSYNLEVTPAQAVVLELFQEKAKWTLEDLTDKLRSDGDTTIARNALYYWSSIGLMRESDEGEWQRLDRGGCGSNTDKQGMVPCSGSRELNVVAHPQLVPAPLDDTEHFSSSIEKDIDEMRMFWMYIKKMLTNLKSMSTARLHTSLQKSVPMYSDKTIEQLDLLLQRLREEEAIELTSANSWRLKE